MIDPKSLKNITTILTVSSPVYSSFLGLYLKQHLKNLNLISYFSDPLPNCIQPAPYFQGYLSNFSRIKGEIQMSGIREVLNISDRIIVPSINTINYMEKKYGMNLKLKTRIIPHIGGKLHGSFKARFLNKDLRKHLVYFGDMYNRLSIDLIEACKKAREDFPGLFPSLPGSNPFSHLNHQTLFERTNHKRQTTNGKR